MLLVKLNKFAIFGKTTCFSCLILIATCFASGQYANEWIDYDKTHYKFNISETGIYRISYEILQQTDIDLIGEHFQLFYKGEEIPIYVTTEGAFTQGDYIEFYGEMNDGTFDTQLYAEPDHQIQNNESLFSDLSAYYLTSNSVGNNKRFEATENNLPDSGAEDLKEKYFMYKSIENFTSSYSFGKPFSGIRFYTHFSSFDEGEGFIGSIVRNTYVELDFDVDGVVDTVFQNTGSTYRVNTNNVYATASEKAHVTARLAGRNWTDDIVLDKHIQINMIETGQSDTTTFVDDYFENFEIKQYDFDVPLTFLNTEPDFIDRVRTKVSFKALDGISEGVEYETKFAVGSLSITYPRDFNFNDEEFFEFELELDKAKYFEIENFNGGTLPVLYDLTEGKRIIPIYSSERYKFKIEPTENVNRKFVLINASAENTHISEINLLEKQAFTNFSVDENQGNYIIITHNKLRDGAVDQIERYKNYRESEQGGSYSVVVADIDDLYGQFSLGIEKHPMSIKNFINFAVDNWSTQPAFLNIIGKAVRYDQASTFEGYEACLVPSYGYTPSDLMLTTKSTQDYFPQLAIGRIPAKNSEEVRAYMDKVIEYENWMTTTKACENITDRAWMKNAISIAKGWGIQDTEHIQDKLNVYNKNIANGFLEYNIVEEFQDLKGATPSDVDNHYDPNPNVKTRMEDGLAFINYTGHSAPKAQYWQFDMQHPSHYSNEGKYPFILSNAPFVGKVNYKSEEPWMAEDYILADNGGAIGFLGLPALLMHDTMHIYANKFIENISYDNFGQTIGEAVKATIEDIYDEDRIYEVLSCQYALTGDPAIKLYHREQPEYLLVDDNLSLDPWGELNPAEVTKLDAKVYFQNWGQTNIDGTVDVVVFQYDENENLVNEITQTIQSPKFDAWLEFDVPLPSDSPLGLNKFVFKVDGNDNYPEDCEENNIAERFVTIVCEDPENDCATTGIFEIAGINVKVGPSPVNSILNFHLNLEKNGTLKIELLSIDGKLIDEVVNNYYSAGQSVINYDLSYLNNGLFLYKISIGNETKMGKITVVK